MSSRPYFSHRIVPQVLGLLILFIVTVRVLDIPLMGPHKTRQADTLFTGYSYCIGDSTFFYPKVAHRENTDGIAIGEFPLFSALISLPCRWTGEWSEVTAKIITYILWILNFFVWSQWYYRRQRLTDQLSSPSVKDRMPYSYDSYDSNEVKWGFLLFFVFSPLTITYLLMPLPDNLGLLSIGLAALFWQKQPSSQKNGTPYPSLLWCLGSLLFALGFLIRPYLFPLLLVTAPSLRSGLLSFGFCVLGYLFWFKYWIHHTQIWYYLTDTKPFTSLFTNGWKVPKSLFDQLSLNHLSYIGVIPFYLALKKNKQLLLAWIFSLLFILLLKGDHFVNHAYYFMAAGFISIIAMCDGFWNLSKKTQTVYRYAYVFLGLYLVQHHWHKPDNQRYLTLPQLMENQKIALTDRIAVYDTFSPQTLYLAKHVGWYLEKDQWKGPSSCPKGARWALLFDPKDDHPYLVTCE